MSRSIISLSLMSKLNTVYCDGFGSLVCHCGGDLCVCGTDGEPCPGCEECESDYFDEDEDYSDEEEYMIPGCCFPDYCLMPGPHYKHECHTVEMLEKVFD